DAATQLSTNRRTNLHTFAGATAYPGGSVPFSISPGMVMSRVTISALITAAAVTACGTGGDGGAPPQGPDPATDPPALTAGERAVSGAASGVGFGLAARIGAPDPRANVVLSPVSASTALGMPPNGGSGATFDAMRSTLGFGTLTQEQLNDAYRGLMKFL